MIVTSVCDCLSVYVSFCKCEYMWVCFSVCGGFLSMFAIVCESLFVSMCNSLNETVYLSDCVSECLYKCVCDFVFDFVNKYVSVCELNKNCERMFKCI